MSVSVCLNCVSEPLCGPGDKWTRNKALSPFPLPLCTCQLTTRLWDMLGDTVPAHSNSKLCPCRPSSRSHLGLLITALNVLLLTRSNPRPPQTNILGGRILIITASESQIVFYWSCPLEMQVSLSHSLSLPPLSFSLSLCLSHSLPSNSPPSPNIHLMTLDSDKVLEKKLQNSYCVQKVDEGKSHALAGLKSRCTHKCPLIPAC